MQQTEYISLSEKIKDVWQGILDFDYTVILENILYSSFQIILIIILTWILMKGRTVLIRRIFKITKIDERKEETLASLLLSLTRYVILIISGIIILGELGIQTGPILASAGILGLAVGFGAQNFVKDIIAGFFILFEDWMRVGDFIKIGEISGTVEELGLRSTVVREWSGKQVHLLNSSISQLVNYNRDLMRPIVSINIPYEYPSAEVKKIIDEACDKINEAYSDKFFKDPHGNIIEPVQLYGITDVENNALGAKYTIIGLVKDDEYWLMAREIRRILLEHLRINNIHVAYPKRIYINEPNMLQETEKQ